MQQDIQTMEDVYNIELGEFHPFASFAESSGMVRCYIEDASVTEGGTEPWNSPHLFETGRKNHLPDGAREYVALLFWTNGVVPKVGELVGDFLARLQIHNRRLRQLPEGLIEKFSQLEISHGV